ncbi:MAG TPA: alpha/beta fold hydrolase [Candidatus Sulfotelmatobacter sp.]|jgi:carboxylesterase|nr:alpha/beta fold hydrolase [Candidatus Sulfotelmatobacter sp.]
MTRVSEQKSLFARDTWWQRLMLVCFGAMPWSGPGQVEVVSGEIADASFHYPGGKAAVILIHGLTGTPTEMRFVGKGLASAGFSVYGLQMAGHCGTEDDLLRTGWKDWYASVEAAYDDVAKAHDVVFVAGLSMGAVMSMHLVARRPGKLRGMGLLSTTLTYDGWAIPKFRFLMPLFLHTPLGLHYRFVENFPYGIKDDRLRQRVVANMHAGNSVEAGNLGMTGASLRELWSLVDVVKAEMPAITTPAIILHAAEDDVASRKNADYCEAHLGGPKKKVLFHESYHIITVDRERNEVVRQLADYFKALCSPDDLSPVKPGKGEADQTDSD